MKCGASQKLLAPSWRLSSRSLKRRVGKRLAVSVDEFVFLQLIVELVRLDKRDWMFEPERIIRDCLDFVRGFEHPAFTPAVNNAIVGRVTWLRKASGISRMIALILIPAWQSMPS